MSAEIERTLNAMREKRDANVKLGDLAPKMLEVLKAAVECGMVPTTSAKEGGAARHSRNVIVADMIRDVIAEGDNASKQITNKGMAAEVLLLKKQRADLLAALKKAVNRYDALLATAAKVAQKLHHEKAIQNELDCAIANVYAADGIAECREIIKDYDKLEEKA